MRCQRKMADLFFLELERSAVNYCMSRILLIEDEERFARMIKSYLKSRLLEVEWVANGVDGLELLKSESFDAAIVDWNLPGLEGVDIIHRYRSAGGMTPVMMLTGRAELKEKVTGFECGADDYLTKPFQADELYVRVKSLLRRPKEIKSPEILIGDLRILSDSGQVFVKEQAISLTKKEFALLELLAKNKGVIVSIDAIIQKAWPPHSEVSVETLRSHFTRLRVKLQEAGSGGWEIKNVYGSGYILEDSPLK